MKIWVINGSNLNLLGIREPEIYGSTTYEDLLRLIEAHADARAVDVKVMQSNHEGDLVDWVQQALSEGVDGLVLNPGAYTHTSIALYDALKSVRIPAVEVHISKIEKRESFRQFSYIRPACIATITGHGLNGYLEAIDLLINGK